MGSRYLAAQITGPENVLLVRRLKAQLAIEGRTYQDWLLATIRAYLRQKKKALVNVAEVDTVRQ